MKNLLLSTTRYYDAEKETGSDKLDPKEAARLEREKIKVDSIKKDDEKTDTSGDKENNKEGSEEGTDDSEESEDEGSEEETEKEEAEKTIEDYKKELATAQKKVERLERRVGKTAGERDQIKKDLAAAKISLEAKVEEGQGLSEEEVERRAETKANEKISQREFDSAVKKLVRDATKVDKDFNTNVNEMAEEIAPIPLFMIGALEDLDNGGAVLAHLANEDNRDEYAEIIEMSPARMVSRLNKISAKIEEDSKPKLKKISKVPPPPETIKGGEKTPTIIPANPTKDMDTFVRVRAQQVAARKAARGH